jgi:glycosyltransferase involved in cell wall biosynthesis
MMAVSRKIKVLEAIRQGSVGGGETHVLSLVEELDKSLFDPIVLSFSNGQMIQKLNDLGIKNHVICTNKAFDFTVWKKVKALIKKEKIDIVHAHGTRANTNILWAAKSLKIPIIYTVHGWSFHDDQQLIVKKIRVLTENLLVKNVKYTVAVSESSKETGQKYINGFEGIVINNGINLKKFDPQLTSTCIREKYGISHEITLVGFISRITKQKDPFTMLDAFYRVLQHDKTIKLLMVGDGDMKSQVVDKARSLGIDDSIYFDGFREDVPELLNAIDIYCLPSLWEGLPIGLLEAMAMEKAIIATNVDGSKEVVSHGENGILIKPEKPQELADAILWLHKNVKSRMSMQAQARKSVYKMYNVANMTRQIENLYHQALT